MNPLSIVALGGIALSLALVVTSERNSKRCLKACDEIDKIRWKRMADAASKVEK